MNATVVIPSKISCRPILAKDLDGIVALLRRGFPGRPRSYWQRGFDRMSGRPVPDGFPRYGFVLETAGLFRGVLIAIYTQGTGAERELVTCNLASWYVEPAFRAYAAQLAALATKRRDVTYINISPAPHTWANIETQGFRRFSDGLFFALLSLTAQKDGSTVHAVTPGCPLANHARLDPAEYDLLETHAAYGCVSLIVEHRDQLSPFVFQPLRVWRGRIPVPAVHLLYCQSQQDVTRNAGVLGATLLRYGALVTVLDASAPVQGLHGFYQANRRPKYTRGAREPRLGNLADTEYAIFGP